MFTIAELPGSQVREVKFYLAFPIQLTLNLPTKQAGIYIFTLPM